MVSHANKILRWIAVGALYAAALVPLYVSNWLYFPFISGKNFAFRILIEIATAAWLILAFRDQSARPRKSAFTLSVLVFIAVLAVSVFLSEDPYKSFWSNFERMEGFIGLAHFALAFLVAGSLFRAKEWRTLALVSLSADALVIGYSLLQFFGVFAIDQGGVRVDASFGNAIYLGVYALFHVFLAGLFAFKTHQTKRNIFLVYLCSALALGNIALIFLSATRGAILGLFVGCLAACVLLACSRAVPRTARRIGIAGIVCAVLVVGGFLALRTNTSLRSSPVFGRIFSVSIAGEDAQARFRIWEISWKGFLERPLFGWGQENFSFVFNKYYDPRLYNRESWFDRAHNAYLDWLIAAGLIGLLAYLALWYFSARALWRKGQKGDLFFSPAERTLFFGFGVAYAVNNIFVFDNGVSSFLFFMLLAYLHHRTVEDRVPAHVNVAPHGALSHLFAPAICVALAFSVYWLNVRPAYAGALLLNALRSYPQGPQENIALFKKALALNTFASAEIREQLAQVTSVVAPISAVPLDVKQAFLTIAANEMDKEIKMRPTDARYYSFMGSLLDSFNLFDQSFPYWEKASMLSPAKQALLMQLGSNRFNAGKKSEAVDYFKKAYELNPENREAVIIYAAILIYTGDRETEKQILASPSFVKSPPADPRLLAAYKAVGRINDAVALWRAQLAYDPEHAALIKQKIADLQNGK